MSEGGENVGRIEAIWHESFFVMRGESALSAKGFLQ